VTEITGRVEHVELCGVDGWADVLLLAPATANTVGKVAAAVDDTPVTTCATTALGAALPVVIVPAMHEPMYDHPGVIDAIDRVESWGVSFVDPRIEEGKAKIPTEETIVTAVARATGPDPLDGQRVVVTSGATTESVDPVRTLSNRASGRTGRAVARACHTRGAEVVVVHDGPELPWATVERVETAAEMRDAVLSHADGADALVSAAAISDYTVQTAQSKLPSGQETVTLRLRPTSKLLDTVRAERPDLTMVGFKAETDGDDTAIHERARELQQRVGLSFVVGNDAGVMGETDTRALLVDGDDHEVVEGSKTALGSRVADRLAAAL
jgi:phosphopantothenoylcysteine decarboxylase/phosphopantothenate--cysteine ligase